MTTRRNDEGPRESRAIAAQEVPVRTRQSGYPPPFAQRVSGRQKRPLGEYFGLTNFGVNHTTLPPGSESALLHRHSKQDEFVFVLAGTPTLVTETGEIELAAGMCAGFPAQGIAHQLVNRTAEDVVFIEIGDRTAGDEGSYPADDLRAVQGPDGAWVFTRKDGSSY